MENFKRFFKREKWRNRKQGSYILSEKSPVIYY